MRRILAVLAMVLISASAFAVDGIVLINQASAIAGGGFPYTITQPGSYRLSGNLTVPPGAHGILIATDNVTIDLNGFAIMGTGAGAGVGHGIVAGTDTPVVQGYYNIAVRNGTIQGMGADGIHLLGDNVVVEDLRVRNNTLSGIVVRTPGFVNPPATPPQRSLIVRRNAIHGNPSYGIKAFGGLITDNTITDASIGIGVQQGAGLVTRNVVSDSAAGLSLVPGVAYTGNTLFNNATQVFGGTNMGQNLCNTAACP
jgi:hypothetical protein